MPSRLEFQLDMGRSGAQPPTRRAGGGGMRLLLLGDFGGDAASRPALKDRRVHRVDVDLLDTVLQRVAPSIELRVGAASCHFTPQAMDDFHPDRLLELLPPLAHALDRLQRLQASATFAQAAAEMSLPTAVARPAAPPAATPAAAAAPSPSDDLLGQLLGGRVKPAAPSHPAAGLVPAAAPAQGIDAFVRSLVAQDAVAPAPASQAVYVAAASAELGDLLRAVLHAPAFQALESAWRGVHFLVSRLDLDASLQVHLLDAPKADLVADIVAAGGRVENTGLCEAALHRWCAPATGERCAALIALHEFGASDADIGLLAALGMLATRMGAPVIAGGDLALAETQAAAGWQALRRSEVAPWVALVAPRLLLRLPYGKGYEATERLAFEELPAHSGHAGQAGFVWGCGALAAAWSLGRAFAADGWQGDVAQERELDDLPAYTHVLADGERELQACAEVFLSEQVLDGLLSSGLMPLASHRHRNAATLLRWQSVALPPQALRGLPGA
ncbi:MAG: type VI secretion system contractile sheath large subunit [Rubrivivax sp.]|jgi:type VI secretion system protein ImpC|nr:type VI secretion system contractile sheath large subunit [Rubrivivax sp.]